MTTLIDERVEIPPLPSPRARPARRRGRRRLPGAVAVMAGVVWAVWVSEVGRSPIVNPQGLKQFGEFFTAVTSPRLDGAFLRLVFDAMLYHEQIPELSELAGEEAETPIVLDHCGCPLGVGYYRGREQERFESWRRDVTELARRPNVYMKIGGFGMIVTGAEYHLASRPPTSVQLAADWQPWFEVCLEAFGAQRCMFESNFPVDKAMYSYAVGWNAFKRLASGCSPTERDDLFAGTATRFYRLETA